MWGIVCEDKYDLSVLTLYTRRGCNNNSEVHISDLVKRLGVLPKNCQFGTPQVHFNILIEEPFAFPKIDEYINHLPQRDWLRKLPFACLGKNSFNDILHVNRLGAHLTSPRRPSPFHARSAARPLCPHLLPSLQPHVHVPVFPGFSALFGAAHYSPLSWASGQEAQHRGLVACRSLVFQTALSAREGAPGARRWPSAVGFPSRRNFKTESHESPGRLAGDKKVPGTSRAEVNSGDSQILARFWKEKVVTCRSSRQAAPLR